MRISSCDDLTPSMPDGRPVASRTVGAAAASRHLFAALHGEAGDLLVAIARDFSPRFERHPGGTVVLDVSGLQRLLGDAPAIAGHLARAGAPRVAVATSHTAAIVLARARSGVTVATGEPEAALRDVPIGILQEFLLDSQSDRPAPPHSRQKRRRATADSLDRSFDVVRRWGLTTIGEFAALPSGELSARLGPDGVGIQRLARGIDPRPLVPDPGVTRFTGSFELEWPIDSLEPLSFVCARLLDPLAAALERADRGGVALHLDLRLTDRTTHARTLHLPAPIRDPRVLRTLLLLDLESHPPSAAVDVVSIEIDPAPGRIVQYSLLARAVPSPETLATLMARLGALVGDTRCGSPVLLDTHRPDGFAMGPPMFRDMSGPNAQPPTPPPSREEVSVRASARPRQSVLRVPAAQHAEAGNSRTESFDGPGRTSRQLAHTQRFHPISSTSSSWEVGVGSWELTPRHTLRRFRPPVAIRVAVEAGRPVRVAIDRRGMPGGTVQQSAGPWRTSGEWWQPERWNRDEWDIGLSGGVVCRVFHDRDSGRWFMEGVVD
jgi:protein ImuB